MYSTRQKQSVNPSAENLFPITPSKNIGPKATVENVSSAHLRPSAQSEIRNLKSQASDLSESSELTTLKSVIAWKDSMLALEREGLQIALADLQNQWKTSRNRDEQEVLDKDIVNTQGRLEEMEREHMVVKLNKKPMHEDAVDVAWMGELMVQDMYLAWLASSAEGDKEIKRLKKYPRGDFADLVGTYLKATKTTKSEGNYRHCAVLNRWLPKKEVTCAHIVPRSFYCEELQYLFGSRENPGQSRKNGIFLTNAIENAWDNGDVAIIPDGSIESNPIEYKIVQINPEASDNLLHEDISGNEVYLKVSSLKLLSIFLSSIFTSTSIFSFILRLLMASFSKVCVSQDVDGKRLSWQTGFRPARRFLYFRFAMAYIKCNRNGWPTHMLPRGQTWATPEKKGGYLRAAPFMSLVRAIGDDLIPEEVLEEGTFTDKESELALENEAAEYAMKSAYRNYDAGGEQELKEAETEQENDEPLDPFQHK